MDWNSKPLAALIGHIVSAHHAYLKFELPRIQKQLALVYAAYRERDGATLAPLPGLLFLMHDELDFHMHREESLLFPAIAELERAEKPGGPSSSPLGIMENPIRVMLSEHESAGCQLDQIRATTRDYALPFHACDTYRALYSSFEALDRDLRLHIHLENDILFPRALALQWKPGNAGMPRLTPPG